MDDIALLFTSSRDILLQLSMVSITLSEPYMVAREGIALHNDKRSKAEIEKVEVELKREYSVRTLIPH